MHEAQDHGEATGHASFSESTEAVLNLVCADCGKPCRSATEQDVHTKRTGHTQFVDKTAEAAKPVDAEAQMKQLRAEAAAEARGLDVTMVDLTTDKAAEEGGPPSSEPDGELITPEVPQALLDQLTTEFGFTENKARRALYQTGTDSIEVAVNWLGEHQDDADVDTPLLVPKNKLKRKLTKEEARVQAEELRKAAAARREREEKESERVREKERIRMGKELQAAKRIEEDQERRRNIAWRQREKEEEAKAKEKIRIKLEEDKRERRRKLGLPEEPTAEEVAAEAAKSAAKAQAEADAKAKAAEAAAKAAVRPVGVAERLRAELVAMKRAIADAPEKHKTAFETLMKLVGNVAQAPDEEKYRRIRLTNATFQQRVASIDGGVRFLNIVGFVADASGEFLDIPRSSVNIAVLNAAGAELHNALENPFFGVL